MSSAVIEFHLLWASLVNNLREIKKKKKACVNYVNSKGQWVYEFLTECSAHDCIEWFRKND